MAVSVRGSRILAPSRSRLPSGQLRAPGRAFADDPRPTLAEFVDAPLDFVGDRADLPCQQPDVDVHWWYAPEWIDGTHYTEDDAERAKVLCQGCPVRVECAAWATTTRQAWGIWGGLDPAERGIRAPRRTA